MSDDDANEAPIGPSGYPPPAPIAPVPGAAAPRAPIPGGPAPVAPTPVTPPPVTPGQVPPPAYGAPQPPAYGAPQPPAYGAPAYGPPGAVPPGWTPPPKPGLVPLRPLSFGEIFGASFAALRTNTRTNVALALPIQFVANLLIFGLTWFVTVWTAQRLANPASFDDAAALIAGSTGLSLLASVAAWIVSGVASQVLQGLLVAGVSREILGEKPRVRDVGAIVRGRVGALIGWALLYLAAAIVLLLVAVLLVVLFAAVGGIALATLGSLLLGAGIVVLLVWITTKLAVVPSAIVIERLSLRAALARSWRLTTGRFWVSFGSQFLVTLLISVVGSVITIPITLIASFGSMTLDPTSVMDAATGTVLWVTIATSIVQFLVSVITSIALAGCIGVLYTDLRMRRDGLDIELVRAVEARAAGRAAPDPFLTASSLPRP